MAIISDNAIDFELVKMKALAESLKKKQTIFSAGFHNMNPKERATMMRQIEADHRTLSAFLEASKRAEINNSGTKFGIENLKQSYQALMGLWRKTERSMETVSASATKKISGNTNPQINGSQGEDVTEKAVHQYMDALKNMGHSPTPEMAKEFKERLTSAYAKAKETAGGKDLTINIVQDGSKIKVRMEPK